MASKKMQRIFLLIVGLCLVGLFFFFDLGQYLTLSYLKASQEQLQALYVDNRIAVLSVYMGIYILVAALSLPGAAVLTLAGGGLFGLVVGTVVVSFASTIGATLACFVARFLLQNWVQEKFADKLEKINQGIEAEGAFYLFTMRLIPAFPFFVVNLVMGVTRISLFTFYWVSQVGMLAGTLVFVNAGKELAKIDSLAGILSPGLLGSFVILGIFPITVKKIMAVYRKKFQSC